MKLQEKKSVQSEETKCQKLLKRGDQLLLSNCCEFLMTFITIFMLYAGDVNILASTPKYDIYYEYIALICFIIFTVEVILLSLCRHGYFLRFFFWMDLISTLTIILDIHFILVGVGLDFSINKRQTSFSQISRATRLTVRVTRLIRVIRIIRVARLYKYASRRIEIKKKLSAEVIPSSKKQQTKKQSTERKASLHRYDEENLMTSKGQIQNSLILRDNNQTNQAPKSINQNRRASAVKRFNPFVRKSVTFKSIYEQEELKELDSESDSEDDITLLQKQSDEIPPETIVGKALQQSTSQKSILIMFSIVLSMPIFNYNTYFTSTDAFSNSLTFIENINRTSFAVKNYESFINQYSPVQDLVYLRVRNKTYIHQDLTLFRSDDLNFFTSASGLSFSIVTSSPQAIYDASLRIGQTTFLIILVIMTAAAFGNDIQSLVVNPLEEMMFRIKQISNDPLQAKFLEEEFEISQQSTSIKDECGVLKSMIVKTGALLALGFGEAGTQIIKRNLASGGFDPTMAGVRVMAIFGFCDIRNFTDTTEILQEQVMQFVNEIAKIVHSSTTNYYGAPNKNIGDAFLLVWKYQDDWLQIDKENNLIIKNQDLVENYSDMPLFAFAEIISKIRRSRNLMELSKPVEARIPKYQVRLGIGLHVGEAIEGPIGSKYKIDCSYLGSNVNVCGILEEQTKTYGSLILLSGQLYKLLSRPVQEKIRHLDRVLFNGQTEVLGCIKIYTRDVMSFDVDIAQLQYGSKKEKKHHKGYNPKIARYLTRKRQEKRFERIKNNRLNINQILQGQNDIKRMVDSYSEEFRAIYHEGLAHYLDGRWQKARPCFQSAQQALESKVDGACAFMLDYMSRTKFLAPYNWKGFRNATKE